MTVNNAQLVAPDDQTKLPNTYPMVDTINNPAVPGLEAAGNERPWFKMAKCRRRPVSASLACKGVTED